MKDVKAQGKEVNLAKWKKEKGAEQTAHRNRGAMEFREG